jgi:hypothetical protein
VIHAHLGEHRAAVADLSEAVRRDDSLAPAYHERGLAYASQGEYDRALADCDRVLALEPGRAQAYLNRSIVHHYRGATEQALADYARALQIDPRCAMAGWDPSLAESARSQTTQQLADYLDGLRPEPPVAEIPPPSEFSIVVVPPEAAAPAAHSRAGATPAALPAGVRPQVAAALNGKSKPRRREAVAKARPADETPPSGFDLAATVEQPSALALLPEKGEESPPVARPDPGGEEPGSNFEPEPAADDVWNILTEKAGPDPSETAPSPPPARKEGPARGPAKVKRGLVSWEPLTCPNCLRETVPAEGLPGGRVRCSHCKSVFPRETQVKSPANIRPPAERRGREPNPLKRWRRPLMLGGSLTACLVLLVAGFRSNLFARSDRVAVHPAQGRAEWEGRPIPNATIFLHPVWVKEPAFPRPRATVKEDGTFVLGTYAKDDGAPAGEYRMTIQWFSRRDRKDDGRFLDNALPAKYARAETSDLTVRIQPDKNEIPALRLTRGAKR